MGCCDNKSLKRVTKIEDAIVITIIKPKDSLLLLHKDDIASFSSDDNKIYISLKIGYVKEFSREDLLSFEDIVLQLKNLKGDI